jgi:ribosomal-protein-alanine acetyltransferase
VREIRQRRATLDDAAAIAAVEAAAAHTPWTEAQVRSSLSAPTTSGWVAVGVEGALLGHLLASDVAEEGEILTLAVAPSARRRGIARALVRACTDHWLAVGVRAGWLEVRDDNDPARGLYAGTGFSEAGARRGYYRDGVDAVVMRWTGP